MNYTIKNRIITFITLIVVSSIISKATNVINFDSYTADDGLSNEYVTAIVKDAQGFVWIGSRYGLNKFDGISFSHYFNKTNDSLTISNNFITSLVVDDYGKLWVGTMSGLCLYNSCLDNFYRINLKVDGNTYTDSYINEIFIDSRGLIWVSTFQGIFSFEIQENYQSSDLKNIRFNQFFINEHDINATNRMFVNSIQEDKNGDIWFVSYSQNIYRYNIETGSLTEVRIHTSDSLKLSDKRKNLLIDSENDFYLSVGEYGVYKVLVNGDSYTLESLRGIKGEMISTIFEDHNSNLWFGDQNSEGLSVLKRDTKNFEYLMADNANPKSILINKINSLYEDNTGTMWVGTIIGVNKYSPGKVKFNRYFWQYNKADGLSFNNVLCFEESRNGDIWIGTDGGGLNKLNRKTGSFVHFKHDSNNPNSLSSNSIVSMCEDSKGVLWLGTFNGGLVKRENGKFTVYKPNKNDPYSISNLHIWSVLEDSKGNLWIGTLNSGLQLFDRKNNRFYSYVHEEDKPESLINLSIHKLFEDSKQNLYITTYSGVSVVNLNEVDFSQAPPKLHFKNLYYKPDTNSISRNAYCVNEDLNGNIWFGTIGGGLDKFDPKTGMFTNYSGDSLLPGNTVSSILVDHNNTLWLATNNGLVSYNPETHETTNYDRSDGLLNKDLKGYALKTKDGQMYFGGIAGFNSFYPEEVLMRNNSCKPPVVFTDLKIFNSLVNIGEDINGRVILDKHISKTEKITLKHHENFITICFAALDYTAPEKNLYKYKMDGFNTDWVDAGNLHEAVYTNLDPGKYIFRVKASNNDDVWNEEGATLQLEILPPWWETLVFRIVTVVLILALFALIVLYRINSLKRQKKRLIKQVKEKTAELLIKNELLQNKSNELETTNKLLEEKQDALKDRQKEIQTQNRELLYQKEVLENLNNELNQLNATKDKFFSIIAHDVRTPFNAILGFCEVLLENYASMDDDSRLETLQIMHKSSQNLYYLFENLLNWSRAQRGTIKHEPQIINCSEAINKVFKLLDGISKTKNIALNYDSQSNLEVYADKFMFDTILRNLIGNALKFTRVNGNVNVVTRQEDNKVIIEVSDNGVGIEKERIKKLFKIDSNQSTKGTIEEKGTGLGLILVKDFVEMNGGEIWVQSEIDKGSSFFFSLPLSKGN